MQFKTYKTVIAEMMKEYRIDVKTALEWDTFGVKNLRAYFQGYKLDSGAIHFYISILNGKESV